MCFDLHVHSCLSPCASLEMSPSEIVGRVKAAGLDGFALTDHQSARNCEAVVECARRAGVGCLCGLEVCTAEEVHCLALFDAPAQAMEMTDWVYAALPRRVNDPDTFGDQPVVTWDDDVVELEWRILAAACGRTLQDASDRCRELGGVFIAAHVDRMAFSVFSQLGMLPGGGVFDAVELSRTADAAAWLPRVDGLAATRSSDAHNLDDVARVWTDAPLDAFSVAALRAAFANRATAPSPRLTSF